MSVTCGGDLPCSLCFTSHNNGDSVTYKEAATGTEITETVACNPAGSLTVAPTACSFLTASNDLGNLCRNACGKATNGGSCYEGGYTYCQENPENSDCACLRPEGTSFTTASSSVTYTSLQAYVDQNTSINMDPRCLYAACGAGSASAIIQDPTLDCPSVPIHCTISGVDITLEDVKAQNINLISQNCNGSSKTNKTRKTTTTGFLGMSSAQSTSVVAGVALIMVAVGVATFFFVKAKKNTERSGHTLDHRARRALLEVGRPKTKTTTLTPTGPRQTG